MQSVYIPYTFKVGFNHYFSDVRCSHSYFTFLRYSLYIQFTFIRYSSLVSTTICLLLDIPILTLPLLDICFTFSSQSFIWLYAELSPNFRWAEISRRFPANVCNQLVGCGRLSGAGSSPFSICSRDIKKVWSKCIHLFPSWNMLI